MMKNVKPYAVFALLLPSLIAVDLMMDMLMKLPTNRMIRNFTYPFMMLDPIEKFLLLGLAFMFIRKPLYLIVQRMMPGKQTDSKGSQGGSNSSSSERDQSGGSSSSSVSNGAPEQANKP